MVSKWQSGGSNSGPTVGNTGVNLRSVLPPKEKIDVLSGTFRRFCPYIQLTFLLVRHWGYKEKKTESPGPHP